MKNSISTIAIAGAGTMGQGIAATCAISGFSVKLYDVKEDLLDSARLSIRQQLQRWGEKKKLSRQEQEVIFNRIEASTGKGILKGDLIVEAVVEDLEVKRSLLQTVEAENDNCILVSNTSALSITALGSALKAPQRFAGLHFFNPATHMKLVEIVKGPRTDDHTMDTLKSFVRTLEKTPVSVNDSPGFIVNRVARQFYVESLQILEEGICDFPEIDRLMKSTGFKMGPFELMDLIGIDINYSVTESLFQAFQYEPRFRPSRIQKRKIEEGNLGRKSGRGFYEYKD